MQTPTGLTPAELAAALSSASGSRITPGMIAADVSSGAPTNPDGTLNLIRYTAWLLKQGRGDRA